jgi:hypothetical protein
MKSLKMDWFSSFYNTKSIKINLRNNLIFLISTKLSYLSFQSSDSEASPNEVYSRNASCALNLISTFLLEKSIKNPCLTID